MRLSGFTIARNVVKYNYPILESINSILPICDEFVVNVGDSEDDTLAIIRSIKDEKIRIIENKWDMSKGSEVLSTQTNLALKACRGKLAFYLQSDEVVHEDDLQRIKKVIDRNIDNEEVDAFRFYWFHFYGSYYRYRIDGGWYQKQDRIIRNSGEIESYGDAYGFRRKDESELRRVNTQCFIYHYGWVQPQDIMTQRRVNAEKIGFVSLDTDKKNDKYNYGDLNRFPPYFGNHPKVMTEKVKSHQMSQNDLSLINQEFWWHPMKIFHVRYKTFNRVRKKIE